MSELVIDASVSGVWLFDDESDPRADDALDAVSDGGGIIPQHWHFEIRNALLVGERRGRIAPEQVAERLDGLSQVPLRTDAEPDLDAAMSLARAHNLSFYDAVYLELALRRNAALATLDARLARAASAEGVQALP